MGETKIEKLFIIFFTIIKWLLIMVGIGVIIAVALTPLWYYLEGVHVWEKGFLITGVIIIFGILVLFCKVSDYYDW